MRSLTALSIIAAHALSSAAFADCEHPPLVMIPAQEDIQDNQEEVVEATQEYFANMQEYVACIQEELDAAGDDAPEITRRVLVQRNNAAVAEAEAVQRWFNSRFENDVTVELPAEPSEE